MGGTYDIYWWLLNNTLGSFINLVTHAYNPPLERWRQGDQEFKVILAYKWRPTWTAWDTVLKKKSKKERKEKEHCSSEKPLKKLLKLIITKYFLKFLVAEWLEMINEHFRNRFYWEWSWTNSDTIYIYYLQNFKI